MTALSFHVGEVQRNPYHLLVPAWMQDNVRRGGELVGGQGGAAPEFDFCTLYRLRRWMDGRLQATFTGGRMPAAASAATLCSHSSAFRRKVCAQSVGRAAKQTSSHETPALSHRCNHVVILHGKMTTSCAFRQYSRILTPPKRQLLPVRGAWGRQEHLGA